MGNLEEVKMSKSLCTVLIRFKATLKNNYVLQDYVHAKNGAIIMYERNVKCRIFSGSP